MSTIDEALKTIKYVLEVDFMDNGVECSDTYTVYQHLTLKEATEIFRAEYGPEPVLLWRKLSTNNGNWNVIAEDFEEIEFKEELI